MLSNYLLITFRNLLKNKVFSMINIAGLSLGLACCALLGLYIQDEFSYEKHIDGHERIYRITSALIQDNGVSSTMPRTSPPVAMALLREFPELESATRVVSPPEVEQHLVTYKDKTFYEKKGYLVDSTFLKVFPFELREGNPETALDAPATVILSDKLAQKLFGHGPALDETIVITSGWAADTFRITGVLKPRESKSHVDADFYMSMNSNGWGKMITSMEDWIGNNFIFSYIRLKPKTSVSNLEAKFPALLDKYAGETMKKAKRQKTMDVQALTDVHLHSDFDSNHDLAQNGSISYIYVMTTVAVFILLIACINFMNLATARSAQRASEVGVRKTMGANRTQLIRQFMGESLLLVILAMIISIGMMQIGLPVFNSLTGKAMTMNSQNWTYLAMLMGSITIVTGVFAGSYPAFYLSSFQPARVLKGKHFSSRSSNFVRKSLVVVQFVIAITLIASSIVIYHQLKYIQDKDLGFDSNFRVVLPLRTKESREGYTKMKDQLSAFSGVKSISASTSLPSTQLVRDFGLYTKGKSMKDAERHYIVNIDEKYFDLLNVSLIAGRDLRMESDGFDFASTDARIMVNRTSLKKLGIAEDQAVGSRVMWTGQTAENPKERTVTLEVVGVVEDFHYNSLHSKIDPVVFFLPESKDSYVFMGLQVDPRSYAGLVPQIENAWNRINPTTPFEIQLLSDSVAKKYEHDQQVSQVIIIFTGIAIFISCLGLYGLSVYVGERRIKEIGIRKVLGASTTSIVKLLSSEFIILIAIAFCVAVPLGYYAMNKWLESFAYKIEMNILFFVLAGLISFGIAWITIGFESVRAAISNPVDSLKND